MGRTHIGRTGVGTPVGRTVWCGNSYMYKQYCWEWELPWAELFGVGTHNYIGRTVWCGNSHRQNRCGDSCGQNCFGVGAHIICISSTVGSGYRYSHRKKCLV